MSKTTEDDLETLTEDELLALPEEALPNDPSRLRTIRSTEAHERDFDELLLELAGDTSRHLMISAEKDPKEKQRREEQHRREQQLAWEQQMRDIRDRQDRLLLQIEERQIEIEKHRKEIEDNALRLRDGRRIYVDGDRYRDGEGRVLTGADEADAARQHEYHANASTWQQKTEADRDAEELRRLREKILKDREDGIAPDEAAHRLTGYEKEFNEKAQDRAAQAPVVFGSGDYMAELGGDAYALSTVPAFTQAAAPDSAAERRITENDTSRTQRTPRPGGQGTLKPA
jgi:hypothetical protein